MYTIAGTIEGVRPINFNRKVSFNKRTGHTITPEETKRDAPLKVHRHPTAGIVISEDMFHSCMLAGCSLAGLKMDRKGLWQYLKGAVQVEGDLILGKQTHDSLLETEVIVKGKGTCLCVYNCYPQINTGWKADFRLLVGDDRIQPGNIRIAIEHGGLFVGIGAWRPKYGRFIVTKFETE